MVSMNKLALDILEEVVSRASELGVDVLEIAGSTVVDMGVRARGGFEAGLYLSRICLGGLASVEITRIDYGDLVLPATQVYTSYPIEACMASQYAGWRISVGEYFAMASGPARALARKPKRLYEELGYSEESSEAVIVLETSRYPSREVVEYISSKTGVKPCDLYIVVASTNSVAGSVQVSARIVETGIHKLHTLGFNIKSILYGYGVAPIAPLHPDQLVMLGRTNDMILYGGEVFYIVEYSSDEELLEYIEKTPSTSSKDYGRSLAEKVRETGIEFLYKVDPGIFAPAVVEVNNIETGSVFRKGCVNIELIKKSISLKL